MRYISTIIGSAIVGALVFGIWPKMWKSYGIAGGWLAAVMLMGIAWFMNHWLGIIENPPGKILVDQGWPIAAGVAWAIVRLDHPGLSRGGPLGRHGVGGRRGDVGCLFVRLSA